MTFSSPIGRTRLNTTQSIVPNFNLKSYDAEPAITALVGYLIKNATADLRTAVNLRLKDGALPVGVIANEKTREALLSFVDGKGAKQVFYYDGREILPANLTEQDVQHSYSKLIEDLNDYDHPGHNSSSNPTLAEHLSEQQKIITKKVGELNALAGTDPKSSSTVEIAISKI